MIVFRKLKPVILYFLIVLALPLLVIVTPFYIIYTSILANILKRTSRSKDLRQAVKDRLFPYLESLNFTLAEDPKKSGYKIYKFKNGDNIISIIFDRYNRPVFSIFISDSGNIVQKIIGSYSLFKPWPVKDGASKLLAKTISDLDTKLHKHI